MDFIEELKARSKDFGGIPFWSWNDKLDEKELRKQIGNMDKIGLKGFFMHARGGLLTEYASDEWYNCVNACVDEAEKRNMQAWAYDENGWPSGFAGGKLLEDKKNWAPYLIGKIGVLDENAFASYSLDGKRIYSSDTDCLNIYREYDSSYVDVMDESIIRKFIALTHEEYKQRVGDEFGVTMPGFFTDEPQYYRYHTAWSDTFLVNFEREYGYSVFDALPALFIEFDGAEEKRYDYWLLCHRQYTHSFAEQIYNWCEQNNVKLTGHSIEELSISFQMACSGGVMPFYEFEHIPGIDHLGRSVGNDLAVKQVTSVAAQLNKPRVLTESFATCGWDVSPNELKRLADWQLVTGVNLLCTHLYPYSERGERKYDYPAHYSAHLPWQKHFAKFNSYFANVGAALAGGKDTSNALIIHPMHSAYLRFMREGEGYNLDMLEKPLLEIMNRYGDDGVQYHLGDETVIARHGSVENGLFRVGECAYKYVVLPHIETLDKRTAELLKEFVACGGKLLLEDNAPTRIDGKTADLSFLKSTVTYEEILRDRPVIIHGEMLRTAVRRGENGKIYYIANIGEKSNRRRKMIFRSCRGIKALDLVTLKEIPCPFERQGDDIALTLNFGVFKSYLLIEDACEPCPKPKSEKLVDTVSASDFSLLGAPENCLVLDYASLSLDGKNYEPVRYIKHIHELLLKRRHEGKTYIKFCFTVDMQFPPESLFLCIEPLKNLRVRVNGRSVMKITKKRLDKSFALYEIGENTHNGKNEIVLKFDYYQSQRVYDVLFQNLMESMRNSLSLDTEIEPVYLFGEFGVKGSFKENDDGTTQSGGDYRIICRKKNIYAYNTVIDGYPFFHGKLCIQKSFTVEKNGTYRLKITGRFAHCAVYINNRIRGELFFNDSITVNLHKGENIIRLELTNSLRNTLGPLHHKINEPTVVCPAHFTFEGAWGEDTLAPNYTPRYSFVRFGIDDIEIYK